MLSSIKLIGQWVFTMTVALGVAICLCFIWGIASVAILVEDIRK